LVGSLSSSTVTPCVYVADSPVELEPITKWYGLYAESSSVDPDALLSSLEQEKVAKVIADKQTV